MGTPSRKRRNKRKRRQEGQKKHGFKLNHKAKTGRTGQIKSKLHKPGNVSKKRFDYERTETLERPKISEVKNILKNEGEI